MGGALLAGPPTARAYCAVVRSQVRAAARDQIDWRDIVAALRPITPRLWHRLPITERAQFLRHLRPYWEAHRHRSAPATAAAVQSMIERDRLVLLAGSRVACSQVGTGVEVEVRRRSSGQLQRLRVGAVVNCVGPETEVDRIEEPLIRSLREQGWLRPDVLRLGLDTGDGYETLGSNGQPSGLLFYVGPLLRGRYWESTAVPELRAHVAMMVRDLVASLQLPRRNV
jgi:uncharacterized NAD(P)/FAD-binding protein YdhS